MDEMDAGQYEKKEFTGYAPTCFMLVEAAVFERIGFMDERYFVYYDDTDFVWRAVKLGTELCYSLFQKESHLLCLEILSWHPFRFVHLLFGSLPHLKAYIQKK